MSLDTNFNNLGLKQLGFIFLGIVMVLSVLFSGCLTIATFSDRSRIADVIADKSGFKKAYVETGDFTLLTYQKIKRPGGNIRVYIEGDGKAWQTRTRLSDDPTPSQPVALYLAGEDPFENVAYIARPGQFPLDTSSACDPTYWSVRRFSPEVVTALNKAVDNIRSNVGSSGIELIGYSGGGALAVLIAARRDDVISIRTIAGNLDHKALCKYHRVCPLEGSLNPIDYASSVRHIPQRHFIGSKDTVVPVSITQSFVETENDKNYDRITVVNGATHTKGWAERWRELLILFPL